MITMNRIFSKQRLGLLIVLTLAGTLFAIPMQPEVEGHRTMSKGTQQVMERIRGGEYQIGRGLEEGCDYTETYAKHQVGWETCRNSEAYAREYTCYQRPIEWKNGNCGTWWKSLPMRAGIPRGAM